MRSYGLKPVGARRLAAGAGVVLGVVLVALGGYTAVAGDVDETAADGGVGAATTVPSRPGLPSTPTSPAATATTPPQRQIEATPPPVLMTLLGRDVAIQPVGLQANGTMELPPTPDIGGWWSPGTAPGSATGTVVVAGHVDTAENGPGIFAELASATIGSLIAVSNSDGRSYDYVVTAVEHFPKDRLPADLFTTSGPHRLAIVTCTGPFDVETHAYTRNLVVFARPLLP